jgi:CDP-paratose 2-epimerase
MNLKFNKLLITGSGGLIGTSCVEHFKDMFQEIHGIDNDFRGRFFGSNASNQKNIDKLKELKNYKHHNVDIQEYKNIEEIFKTNTYDYIIHTAAQPSHDWAANNPLLDFNINATSTLQLLELLRNYCPESVFLFLSTNKVYGDNPNKLPLIEEKTRYENYSIRSIDESMSLDNAMHSIFGVSKCSADLMVQEYGKYFNLKTTVLRAGCLTGEHHAGVESHGFLNYLVKCFKYDIPYTIYGYKGKQVRDNIHSSDVASLSEYIYLNPTIGEVFNVGGSRKNSCSIIEAFDMCKKLKNKEIKINYTDTSRRGDHKWYISDISKLNRYYSNWKIKKDIFQIIEDIYSNV